MCIQVTVSLQAVQTLRQPESQLISQSAGPSGNRTCGDQIVTILIEINGCRQIRRQVDKAITAERL